MNDLTSLTSCLRRGFLKGTLGCGAYLSLVLAGCPLNGRRAFAAETNDTVVLDAGFARIEKLAEQVWAVISTPSGGSETISNGGIIAGKDKVLAIEGFMTPAGGAWLKKTCKQLTGRHPTHVALTHFHGDHSYGLAGYLDGGQGPEIVATAQTRRNLLQNQTESQPRKKANATFAEVQSILLPTRLIVDEIKETTLDLGGISVRLVSRQGHTSSDLTIELDQPQIRWCGDLFFNRVFPYYGDAIPSQLSQSCQELFKEEKAIYVPGHGSVASRQDICNYLTMIEHLGAAAQKAFREGTPADEAWKEYQLPKSLSPWNPSGHEAFRVAFKAWERELKNHQ